MSKFRDHPLCDNPECPEAIVGLHSHPTPGATVTTMLTGLTARQRRVEIVTRALEREGCGAGASIHGWRCEHPHRYGPCDCVREAASEVLDALENLSDAVLAQASPREIA